jgi:hypothetical protein
LWLIFLEKYNGAMVRLAKGARVGRDALVFAGDPENIGSRGRASYGGAAALAALDIPFFLQYNET